MKKTNFVIIKSAQKRIISPVNITMPNNKGYTTSLEQKNRIKYLGVWIDDKINWKSHISFICSRISKNSGIFYTI